MGTSSSEATLRARLGIPVDARRVLIVTESSHWDPNWLWTSEEYFDRRVRHTLDAALDALDAEPRRVFSIECVFFLRLYWERRPERRDAIRRLANAGRLRLTGTGITTPDTLLPSAEALFRDYLAGREWLREQGITAEPALAYLPDSFGHSPALPSLLAALGLRYAAISRIDGMHFPGDDWRLPGFYPRPGSSAERLERLGTLDFHWRAPDGHTALTHWHAFTYFQGDMLASRGIIRWMGRTFGWADRSAHNVNGKLDGVIARLAKMSRSPYLLCPIGCDFNDPIRDLVALLDRYNRTRGLRSGVVAVNAAQEDYLTLVEASGVTLPTVDLDPNPYWMGFYASRPQLKQRCRRLANDLGHVERRLARPGKLPPGVLANRRRSLACGWDRLVSTNHHDFITGTAPTRVSEGEQRTWLEEGERSMADASGPALSLPLDPPPPRSASLKWSLSDGVLDVITPWAELRFDGDQGGCLTSWLDRRTGRQMLEGPSLDLVLVRDTGGLWRLGHEFRGGTFRPVLRASTLPADVGAVEDAGALRIDVVSHLEGRRIHRRVIVRAEQPWLAVSVEGSVARRRSLTCRFETALRPLHLAMDVPGGVVTRPFVKIYDPTFWCASHFTHLPTVDDGPAFALITGTPAAVSATPGGAVEWIALRNAPKELAFGLLPVLAHPAAGPNDEPHGFEFAVGFTPEGDWGHNQLPRLAQRFTTVTPACCTFAGSEPEPDLLQEPDDLIVAAIKPAEDGDGVIVRLQSQGSERATRLGYHDHPVEAAWECDALERRLRPLPVDRGRAELAAFAGTTTVRLRLQAGTGAGEESPQIVYGEVTAS